MARVGLDQFKENCHCLIGAVRVNTRWTYIENLHYEETWPKEYQNCLIDLKLSAIIKQVFLGQKRGKNVKIFGS